MCIRDSDRCGPQLGEPAPGARHRAAHAGHGDRRGARERGPRGPGLCQARAGAAGGAARRRRGGRGRLRADDHLRRRGGGAARGRPAAAGPLRAGTHHPPPAQLGHLSLLHQLRRHGTRAERIPLHRPAGAAGRLGAGGGRPEHAEGAPPHRRAGAGHGGVRGRRGGLPPRRGGHARPGRRTRRARERGAPGGRAAGGGIERRRRRRGAGAPPALAPIRHAEARGEVRCGAVAVVNGEGLTEMFHELGVHTIDGGPTLNPSTYDLLAGIHEVPAEEVVLLTNSANVIMAAEHAARLSDKQVLVAHTTSQQAGLAAAVALALDRSIEENGQALSAALSRLHTGAVAEAARDDAQGRFGRGEAVGFVEDEVLAWGDPRETLRAVLGKLAQGLDGEGPPELISVLAGEDAPLGLGAVEGMLNGGIELELRSGGQSAYWWLLSAE